MGDLIQFPTRVLSDKRGTKITGGGPKPPTPPPPPDLNYRVSMIESKITQLVNIINEDRELLVAALQDLGEETRSNSNVIDRVVKWLVSDVKHATRPTDPAAPQ